MKIVQTRENIQTLHVEMESAFARYSSIFSSETPNSFCKYLSA